MDWKTMLTYISGFVDEELLLRRASSTPAKLPRKTRKRSTT